MNYGYPYGIDYTCNAQNPQAPLDICTHTCDLNHAKEKKKIMNCVTRKRDLISIDDIIKNNCIAACNAAASACQTCSSPSC